MAIRVLLADDHRLILDALQRAFEEVEGIEIVGTAGDGRKVVPLIARTNPDIVLLDVRMPEMAGLTERETAMLRALARGLSNAAISKEFWVTEQTVKFHLTNIYRKLGVKNRTEATRYAYQHGLADELAAVG